ncbi:MAG: NAD(P)-dependent alcohol dehydrogenase [Acidobacteria bacterium]|nr:NAD(P)-dependent alcohol dehydrogenase [Acidobacteriota bacterium]
MKAFEIRERFGLDALTLTDRPEPRPGPGKVRLKLRAASLNFRDLLMMQGLYNPRQALPLIPLSDGVGEAVEVGEGVTRVAVGDRVAGQVAQEWIAGAPTTAKLRRSTLGGPLDGMLAEYIVLDEDGVVHVPGHLTDEEAATLPCAALTAWNALVTGGLKPGDTVLVLGTGGVSVFALQFALIMGARVIVTSSSDEKLERALKLGASDGINYRTTPDWDKRVRELTGGIGVDHVVEVGGAGTLNRSIRAARPGGHISLIGVLAGPGEVNPVPILMQSLRVQGIFLGHREMFEEMNRAIDLHRLRPVVDRVFDFADSRAALDHMAGRAHFGKIAIRF